MTEVVQYQPANDLSVEMEYARVVTSGGGQSILPDVYRGNPANALVAIGLGRAMGLSPAESLYRISVIKGKPSAGAELIAANVRKAGHRLRVQGDDTSCTATIIRADDPEFPFTVTRDLEWAKRMGLASNDNYKKQPGTMLQWRAITAVARLACPEALYGVSYTPDEIGEVTASEPVRQVRAADFVQVQEDPQPEPPSEPPITPAQLKALHAALGEAGLGNDRDGALAYFESVTDRPIGSSKELTKVEAGAVIDALKASNAPDPEPTEPTFDGLADEPEGWQ